MSDLKRQLVIAGAIVSMLVAGVVVDVITDPVRPGPTTTTSERVVERAAYCPPAGEGATELRVAAVADRPNRAIEAAILPMAVEPLELAPGRALVQTVADGRAQHIVGSGSSVGAGATMAFDRGAITGLSGTRCARAAATRWYFPAGSSALNADDRLLIHNPFPEDAVVGVVFVTPKGESAPANAADLAIPAGASLALRVNDFVTAERLLSAVVTADRGRVIAWKLMLEQPEALPEGVVATLGARGVSSEWYFPSGHVATGVREVISVLNPSNREALVTVLLATGKGAVQPRKLAEVRVPSRTSVALSLPEGVGANQAQVGGASAIVAARNGVGIVAERTTYYAAAPWNGIETEVGARSMSAAWVLPPLSADASLDRLLLLNPGADPASVSVTLYRADGDPLTPGRLQGIELRPGSRHEVPLEDLDGSGAMIAVVRSSRPIVAERLAMSPSSSDAASVMGIVLGGQAEAT